MRREIRRSEMGVLVHIDRIHANVREFAGVCICERDGVVT